MTRVHDQPIPELPVDGPRPADNLLLSRLYVAIEKTPAVFPRWDDFTHDWDGGEVDEVWDAAGEGIETVFTDAVCDLQGLELTSGTPDSEGMFEAGELAMTLDNRSGLWSQYDSSGRLIDYLPGRRLAVWAVVDEQPWWLWSGVITSWRERASTVEVEGFDDFTVINEPLGKWTPGEAGDSVPDRIASVLAVIAWEGPQRLDPGDVTLLTEEGEDTALEALQRAAISDGGILGMDADGTLMFRDRRWPGGRDDQLLPFPILSDNVCEGTDAVVWDPVLTTDDDAMVNRVTLANIRTVLDEDGKPEPAPFEVTAVNAHSEALYGTLTLPSNRTDDLWQYEEQGQALADYLVNRRGDAYVRIESASLYLHARQHDLWRVGIDRRLGDVVEYIRDAPAQSGTITHGSYGAPTYGADDYGSPIEMATGSSRLDLYLAVQQIHHEITPSSWVVTLATTRTIGNRPVYRWDGSPFPWDDPSPLNRWSP